MEKSEVTERFNNLPRELRTTIIGNDLYNEIKWLTVEKNELTKVYQSQIKRITQRINSLEKHLEKLIDD